MIERPKGAVLVWADLPASQRAGDEDLDGWWARRRRPPDEARCEAASQGDTVIFRGLVKAGRYFRCALPRRAGARFCWRHQAILAGAPSGRRPRVVEVP
jgi:hypothetical protein